MKEQGSSKILMIVVLVAAVLLGLYWFSKNQPSYAPQNTTTPKVESGMQASVDLNSISSDLDNTNVDGPIDTGLSQNDADASSF